MLVCSGAHIYFLKSVPKENEVNQFDLSFNKCRGQNANKPNDSQNGKALKAIERLRSKRVLLSKADQIIKEKEIQINGDTGKN